VAPAEAVFIGECSISWKDVLNNGEKWLTQQISLSDENGKCRQKVRGFVNVFAKWIPVGHEESRYDKQGAKKN